MSVLKFHQNKQVAVCVLTLLAKSIMGLTLKGIKIAVNQNENQPFEESSNHLAEAAHPN